jgi:hypothetical protein
MKHLKIGYTVSRDKFIVTVWNEKQQNEIFYFSCNNEEAAILMVESLKLNFTKGRVFKTKL